MSSDNTTDGAQVLDEENRIDKKLKDRIIDARNRVDEREDDVFVGAPLDSDISRTRGELVTIWATSVKQYLKVIEPLLRSDEIPKSQVYYEQLPIVKQEIQPPDGQTTILTDGDNYTANIQWSKFYSDAFDTHRTIIDNKLYGPGFEPPEPKTIELRGLKDVIETDGFTLTWQVPLNPEAFGAEQEVAQPVREIPLRKSWLEFAVRKADQFLQQAGIGLEIGDPTKEAESDYSDIEDIDYL